jgi:hypothetical protein
MIACLEGQVKTAKIKHEVKAININQQSYKTSKSCQTDNQARKDACTMP